MAYVYGVECSWFISVVSNIGDASLVQVESGEGGEFVVGQDVEVGTVRNSKAGKAGEVGACDSTACRQVVQFDGLKIVLGQHEVQSWNVGVFNFECLHVGQLREFKVVSKGNIVEPDIFDCGECGNAAYWCVGYCQIL